MHRIYLDYAATAPLRDVAREAMLPWLSGAWNASSLHREGRKARQALDTARDVFAAAMNVRPREVYFTASGSESISLALFGIAQICDQPGSIVTTAIEHRAVLAAATALRERGWQHRVLDVDVNGMIDFAQLEECLRALPKTPPKLLSLMLVNNELGTINDIRAVADLAHAHGAIVHCDAVGAGALVDATAVAKNVDALSLAAHKFGGPHGVGILIARTPTAFAASIVGGGQEFGKRAGTENLAAVIGAAAAFKDAQDLRAHDAIQTMLMRDAFEKLVCTALPTTYVHAKPALRAPGISNIAVPQLENDVLPVALDLAGVAVSAGSACASGALQRSHVLDGIGYRSGASIRFSWGGDVTMPDTEEAARRLIAAVDNACRGPSQ